MPLIKFKMSPDFDENRVVTCFKYFGVNYIVSNIYKLILTHGELISRKLIFPGFSGDKLFGFSVFRRRVSNPKPID